MKKGIRFSILTILLTAAVILLPMVQSSLAEERPPASSEVEKSKQNIIRPQEEKKPVQPDEPTTTKDETVRYFVTLTEPSVMDAYLSSAGTYANIRELLLSKAGRSYGDAIKRSQAVAKASITKLVPDSDFNNGRAYSALWNALTFQAPLSVRDKIANLNGVADVYVLSDEWYCLDEEVPDTIDTPTAADTPDTDTSDTDTPDTDEPTAHYAPSQDLQRVYREQINADGDTAADHRGQGTLIAVLDSEFDLTDPVFSQPPPVSVWDRTTLAALSQNIRFHVADNQTSTDCYVSPKIAYAYDYAENDLNTADNTLYHGTLTAALAAGHNGEEGVNAYRGMAPDAQLALMKVASSTTADGRILIRTDALLAALDDAVKLGADAISCSFGSEAVSANRELYQRAFRQLQQAGITVWAAAGNSGYNGQALDQALTVSDIFYDTENTLSAMQGVTAVGAVQNTLRVRRLITIGDSKLYYRSLSKIPLTDILHYIEQEPLSPDTDNATVSDTAGVSDETSTQVSDTSQDNPPSASETVDEASTDTDEPVPPEPLPPVQHNEYLYIDRCDRTTVLHTSDLSGRLVILNAAQTDDLPVILQKLYQKEAAAIALMNADDTIEPLFHDRPFLLLEGDYTSLLREQPTGAYEMVTDDETAERTEPIQVSDFTSYGSVLPFSSVSRIMAPGEDVYTGIQDNGRAVISGTSAVTPIMAGAYAAVKQYVSGLADLSGVSAAEKAAVARSLMLSTAEPLTVPSEDKTPLYASPRVQGFGVLQLEKALTTRAYLSTNGHTLQAVTPSIDDTGTCTFRFTLHNIAEQSRSYIPSLVLQTDRCQDGSNLLQPRSLAGEAEVHFSVEETPVSLFTVQGGGNTELEVTLTMKPAMLTTLQEQFPFGCYWDGYVFLTATDGSGRLTLPLTAFYGNAADLSPFDYTLYDEEESLSGLDNPYAAVAYKGNICRSCPLLSRQDGLLLYSPQAIRTVTDDTGYDIAFLLPDGYPLQDLYDCTITLYDTNGKVLYSENNGTVSAYREKGVHPFEKLTGNHQGLRDAFFKLTDGTACRYEVSARTMLPDGSLSGVFRTSCRFLTDTTKPVVVSSETKQQDGRTILSLTARDNNGLQGFALYAAAYNKQKNRYDYIDSLDAMIQAGYLSEDAYQLIGQQTNEDGSQTFRYDVTELHHALQKLSVNTETWSSPCSDERIAFKAIDNAYNASSVGIADALAFGSASFRFVDQDGHPAQGIGVTIGATTVISDKDGLAYFGHLAPTYYHAVLHYSTEDYTIEAADYLVAILPDQLDYVKEQTVTALQPYQPEPEPSESDPDISALQQRVSTSSDTSAEDDPLYAFFFVGTFLTICIILFLFRKIRE